MKGSAMLVEVSVDTNDGNVWYVSRDEFTFTLSLSRLGTKRKTIRSYLRCEDAIEYIRSRSPKFFSDSYVDDIAASVASLPCVIS